jgi:hypothetical protein
MSFITPVRESSSPYQWGTIRWQPTTLTGTFDEVVFPLPSGTVVLDVFMVCLRGDTGATTTTIDLELNTAGGTAILTGASDNAGTAGLTTWFASEAARKTAVSGTYTVAPIMEIHVLYGRTDA